MRSKIRPKWTVINAVIINIIIIDMIAIVRSRLLYALRYDTIRYSQCVHNSQCPVRDIWFWFRSVDSNRSTFGIFLYTILLGYWLGWLDEIIGLHSVAQQVFECVRGRCGVLVDLRFINWTINGVRCAHSMLCTFNASASMPCVFDVHAVRA